MTDQTEQSGTSSNYLPALNSIVANIQEISGHIAALYQQNHLPINPEIIISIYSSWLGYIINNKIIGDTEQLAKLITDTIQKNIDNGKYFYHTVNTCTEQDNTQLDEFIRTNGVIVVPILKLIQFVSNFIKQSINNKYPTLSAKQQFAAEKLIQDPMETIYRNGYERSVHEINDLNVQNPLIFLLEHVSAMLGWLIGFLSLLTNKTSNYLADKSFLCIIKG